MTFVPVASQTAWTSRGGHPSRPSRTPYPLADGTVAGDFGDVANCIRCSADGAAAGSHHRGRFSGNQTARERVLHVNGGWGCATMGPSAVADSAARVASTCGGGASGRRRNDVNVSFRFHRVKRRFSWRGVRRRREVNVRNFSNGKLWYNYIRFVG